MALVRAMLEGPRCGCTGRRARGSLSQELAAHMGSVWCINSSLVGSYLAMSGEDHVIHVWEVTEGGRECELLRQ
jgi:WD40 repeat protein